jgi:phosphatidylserine/phosphatidylglycerophosphate/cardiolipin synthase-like enzyme
VPDPAKWFLPFADDEGRPWGDGTAMAGRRADGKDPWDENCQVTPIIGGFATMTAIRGALTKTIEDAHQSDNPPGERGHVYIAGYRFNALRDLSDNTSPWGAVLYPKVPADQTAIGLILRLMQEGVLVRLMLWLPTHTMEYKFSSYLAAHVEDHRFVADLVNRESERLGGGKPRGIVALDARTAEGSVAGAHHQKMIVIRGLGDNHVAFCGGVDLAFTRRDAPAGAAAVPPAGGAFLAGDWQSSDGIPKWLGAPSTWPRDGTTSYASLDDDPTASPPKVALAVPTNTQPSDLPEAQGATPIYGPSPQIWHDQHLMLKGPIVRTLEQQFAERWRDSARLYDLSQAANWFGGQVIFSSSAAFLDDEVDPLPDTMDANPPDGAATPVQMWRTIPWRDARTAPLFKRAEFTVMKGISNAVQHSEQLIWIFDQYFWSMPLAHQLNFELMNKPDLRVIVILPPYADAEQETAHFARQQTLGALCDSVRPQVGVFNLWDHRPSPQRGIYCHAKVQTYDGGLLVCGSANLNRRSFLCDSELDCAVADEAVVNSHQRALWSLLFGDVKDTVGQWPNNVASLDAPGSGAAFFSAFAAAAQDPLSYLRPDPWEAPSPTLPAQPGLPTVALPRAASKIKLSHFLDPSSVDSSRIQRWVSETGPDGAVVRRPPRLAEVVNRLETTAGSGEDLTMPNRRQSSILIEALTETDAPFVTFPETPL